ncbi:MAG: DUF5312 domain-containing protein [Treponema sp.]|jgi:hypothetical protein|nr:DUF5312 domain-containing protein [Treponema sp.]
MEAGTFNRLASELSLEERSRLLDRLNSQSSLSREPLYEEPADTPSFDMDEEYKHIPWYYYLFFVLLGFFKKKTPRQIFAEYMVSKLGRVIDAKAPDFYNCQRDLLLPEFHKYLINLKEGARFFYTALDSSVNRDKGAFYAFLASLEMGEVHRRLSTGTDPALIAEKNPGLSEAELRQTAFKAMEDSMAAITEEQRKIMYDNTRFLYCLKEIASFLYDRVILAFARDNEAKGPACTARVVEDQLFFLNNILFSLKEIPPMTLLESLFIFILQEHVGNPGFEINTEIRNLLVKAESSLSVIREFNKQVPLTLILRCTSGNMSLTPKAIGGGEDWFVVYREYWKRRIEAQFAEYMRIRRQRDLTNSFRYFLKGTNLKGLSNVVSDSNPNGMPIKKAFALSFLLTFYSVVFMGDINKTIRPILIDGEFYKRENRTEFTEAYNELIKLEDVIHKFETEISPSGDYGKRYYQARGDMTSLQVKRRKVHLVMEEADKDAERIVDRVREAVQSMINILNGIIKKDHSGKYDTLGNLSRFTAGRGTVLINNIDDAIQKLQKTLQLLDDIDEMESSR